MAYDNFWDDEQDPFAADPRNRPRGFTPTYGYSDPNSGIDYQGSEQAPAAMPLTNPNYQGQPVARAAEAPAAPSGPSPWTSGSGSFQEWFMKAVEGKPYNQQTLLDLEGLLNQSGSRLTGANSIGERTKIWDPTINDWVRVGFGEGRPVWIPQGWGVSGPSAGGGAPAPAAPAAPARDPKWDELYAMLMGRATQSKNIDRNDPIIRAQADAFSANQERSRRNFLGDLAEKSSSYSTGEMLGQQRMTAERVGQATGGFEAELMGRELGARREEIASALEQMGSMLTDDQRLSLQRELALIEDATRRYGMDAENSRFYDDLGFKVEDRRSYWDALRSGLIDG